MFLLRLIGFSPTLWLGVAGAFALGVAAFFGYGAYREYRGQVEVRAKVKERDLKRVQQVRNINRKIDQDTLRNDADLIKRLGEVDKKWLAPKPQDTKPQPAAQ